MEKLNVLNCTDYRSFLANYASAKKKSSHSWSPGVWAKKVGLKSPSTLSMVINGSRNLSLPLARKLIVYFKFNQEEAEHFLRLVQGEVLRAQSEKLRIYFSNSEDPKSEIRTVAGSSGLFSWKTYAVRELTRLSGFDSDPATISRRLGGKVTKEEASMIWEKLLKENLVEKIDGRWRASKREITLKPKDQADLIKFHSEMMKLGEGAIHLPFASRALHSSTISIKAEKLELVKSLFSEMQRRLTEIADTVNGDEVYQFNLLFFPLTEKQD